MATINTATRKTAIYTHEGARAKTINPEQQLRRSVMSCMLWENEFYEDGISIAQRIGEMVSKVKQETVHSIAVEAREQMKLRHIPLLLARYLAGNGYKKTDELLERIIQRPDELTEFLAIYWKDKKQPLSNKVKRGLARAFIKFNEYSLAKYNRDTAIKLRDVLFLCHAKPKDEDQARLWKKLINNELQIPDTWEVELSASKDKKASWERLLTENKLSALALLRNLRNMQTANVGIGLIREALSSMKIERVLPFRFISAARYAPKLEPELELAMFKSVDRERVLKGETILLVDVSGSMDQAISQKSDLNRIDAACGLAILLREVCESVTVVTFSDKAVLIPSRRGFALRDAIVQSQRHNGTYLGQAVAGVLNNPHDRMIVITDEQSADAVPNPKNKGYMINVASAQNGVGYHSWVHVDGWSEAIVDYIFELERETNEYSKN